MPHGQVQLRRREQVYTLDDADEAALLAAQDECTFIWSNREGWPVGVIMSYVWHEGAFWLSVSSLRVRVAAVLRDPRVSVCVTSRGTEIRASQTVTYKGHCEVFSDAETKAWFLPALAERLRPGNPTAQAQFVALNDTEQPPGAQGHAGPAHRLRRAEDGPSDQGGTGVKRFRDSRLTGDEAG